MGLILKMQGQFSVQECITMIHDTNRAKEKGKRKNHMLIFVDQVIAFNKIQHLLLMQFFKCPL